MPQQGQASLVVLSCSAPKSPYTESSIGKVINMAFDPQAQLEMTVLYRRFMIQMNVTGQAIAKLGTDIGSDNIAEARSCLIGTIRTLDQIDLIVRTGTVITDVAAAKEAIEKLSPSSPKGNDQKAS